MQLKEEMEEELDILNIKFFEKLTKLLVNQIMSNSKYKGKTITHNFLSSLPKEEWLKLRVKSINANKRILNEIAKYKGIVKETQTKYLVKNKKSS